MEGKKLKEVYAVHFYDEDFCWHDQLSKPFNTYAEALKAAEENLPFVDGAVFCQIEKYYQLV